MLRRPRFDDLGSIGWAGGCARGALPGRCPEAVDRPGSSPRPSAGWPSSPRPGWPTRRSRAALVVTVNTVEFHLAQHLRQARHPVPVPARRPAAAASPRIAPQDPGLRPWGRRAKTQGFRSFAARRATAPWTHDRVPRRAVPLADRGRRCRRGRRAGPGGRRDPHRVRPGRPPGALLLRPRRRDLLPALRGRVGGRRPHRHGARRAALRRGPPDGRGAPADLTHGDT